MYLTNKKRVIQNRNVRNLWYSYYSKYIINCNYAFVDVYSVRFFEGMGGGGWCGRLSSLPV